MENLNINECNNENFKKMEENSKELERLIKCYEITKNEKKQINYLDENLYRNHAGLFFSAELLKKINIIKRIHDGVITNIFNEKVRICEVNSFK